MFSPQVDFRCEASSLEMTAKGSAAEHHLRIARLYGRIIPDRCQIRVNAAKQRVCLMLHKVSDQEWQFLKG